MATLVKRANGYYHIYYMDDVTVIAADGSRSIQRKQKAVSTGQTDRRAAVEIFRAWEKKFNAAEAQRKMRKLGLDKFVPSAGTLRDLWAEYRAWAEGRIKPKTLASYERSVTFLAEHMGGADALDQIGLGDIEGFIASRTVASPTAANLDVRQLRVVFNWGGRRGLCPPGMMGGVKEKRLTKKEPVILSDEQTLRLFAAADEVDQAREAAGGPSHRLGLFCRLSYYHGFRVSEALALTMRGVHQENGTLSVLAAPDLGFTTKTYQERTVSACPEALWMIAQAGPYDGTGALIGYRATDGGVWREDWGKALQAAGLHDSGFTATHFRKNFALRFLQMTGSEQMTRLMMGHSPQTDTLIKFYLPRANFYTRSQIWDGGWIERLRRYY